MKKLLIIGLCLLGLQNTMYAQELSYYLPQGIEYDENIPTPESVIGHKVGAWHVSHDKLVFYMKALAEASDRITIDTYAHTYEGRPLLLLTITSAQNQQNIQQIRDQHLQLTTPAGSSLDVNSMPAVVWMGYSVHGNEASGSNASMLAAYYLAAAQGSEIEALLNQTVILIDPSINPDGLNRFASWVNSHKSKNVDSSPQSLEHNEAWPRGRTNHYWFDLNRDWLPLQHPESKGRLAKFHYWKPNVLTDHHEMGSNRTFFFQPGVPSRNHPLTPEATFTLTQKIAEYHAQALDELGSLYYTGEGYDDFYYGKGSTYPDVNGAVGILFEQASSRGHAQNTENGVLKFPFAVRNQFTTTLSTLEAAKNIRVDLLNHQRSFYQSALREAGADNIQAYVFGSKDQSRNHHLIDILLRHQIKVHQLNQSTTLGGKRFEANSSYVVPANQAQYRLIKAIFESRTQFQDSLFYDVSAWTLPLAFDLDYQSVGRRTFNASWLGTAVEDSSIPGGALTGSGTYGYLIPWDQYYAPRALYRVLKRGLRAKLATEPMNFNGTTFAPGTIMVPTEGQKKSPEAIKEIMQYIADHDGLQVTGMSGGFGGLDKSWGSPTVLALKHPKVLLLAEGDISSYEVGETWHLLDQRMDIDVTLVAQRRLASVNLSHYTVVVMPNGRYGQINKAAKEKLETWVKAGGVVIAWKNGAKWLSDVKISKAVWEKEHSDTTAQLPYGLRNRYSGAQVIGGAIFDTKADLTHPLLFGFSDNQVPVFRNHRLFLKRSKNPFTNPLMYTENPLLSGYIHADKEQKLKNTPALEVSHQGKGKVITLTDNPNFRAFWYGTNRLFLNALFFGHLIDSEEIK